MSLTKPLLIVKLLVRRKPDLKRRDPRLPSNRLFGRSRGCKIATRLKVGTEFVVTRVLSNSGLNFAMQLTHRACQTRESSLLNKKDRLGMGEFR